MFRTQALRRIGAPGRSRIGHGTYFNQFSGLSDQIGWGFSVISLAPDQSQSDPAPICLQAHRRWYSQFPGAFGAPPADCQWRRSVAMGNLLGCSLSFEYTPVRYFAAPVQAKPKPKPTLDSSSGPRINGAITAPFVRLVTDEGHGIVSRREALDRARKLNIDLVEVQRNANPPVCKMMDFHKEKFKQEVKEKERVKSKHGEWYAPCWTPTCEIHPMSLLFSKSAIALRSGENKEVRFKAKTEPKDLKIKAETVVRLMERGYRVKCTAMPTGKEEEDLGGLLSRLLPLIEDVSVVESGPHVDSRQAYVIVRHMKFATKKSGKKVSKAMDTVAKGFRGAVPCTPTAVNSTSQDGKTLLSEEEWEPVDCSSEAKDEAQLEQNPQHLSLEETTSFEVDDFKEEGGWTEFNTKDSSDLFDFDSKEGNTHSGFTESMNTASSHAYSNDKDISDTSHQKLSAAQAVNEFTAPQPRLGSLRSVLEMSKDPSNKGRFRQPNLTERSNILPHQGRMQQEPIGESQGQFYPSTHGSPSSPGILKVAKTPDSGDQGRSGVATISKPNDTKSPSKSYGIFSSRIAATDDGKFLENSNSGTPGDVGSHRPSYGMFSTPKVDPGGELRNSGDETTRKHRNPASPTPSYGIFSIEKSAASSDQKNSGGGPTGKSSSSSAPTPRYGIFSATKTASSGN